MNPKILLIGKNGQVGGDLFALLPSLGHVTALGRAEMDLGRPEQIRETVRSCSPEIIVNAAAYTAVDKAESEASAARAINEDAPRVLADEARKCGALLVHYSTDYVFDGTKDAPYVEDDAPNPLNVYGLTKLAGERAIQQSGAAYLIFRTAWIYGREGRNFLLTILRLATEKEELRIVRDQIGAPTWSREVASATAKVLSQLCNEGNRANSFREHRGLYHLTAAGETSWCGFAVAILEQAALADSPQSLWFSAATQRKPLIARRIVPIGTADYPTPARRPPYSVLSNALVADRFGVRPPDWNTQLKAAFRATSGSAPNS